MKVYIGGYPDYRWNCEIHYNYMNKKYGYEWKENTRFEKFLEKCEGAIQWIYDHSINYLLKHRKRKIKVRIDTEDTWSMDNTLAHIVLPMLKQLKATKHGSPYVDKEDLPEHLRLTEREDKVFNEGYWNKELNASEEELKAASNKFHSQFNWVLDQMIWSFEQEIGEEADYKHYYDPYEPGEVIEDDPNELFDKKWRMEMGKFNSEKHQAFNERKQRGFTLFGKYYQCLWD
jgi:hypothetical protein